MSTVRLCYVRSGRVARLRHDLPTYGEIPFGLWTTALPVHITWVLPFAFLTLFPRMHCLDRSLEEAAADLGAKPMTVLFRIVLPIIKPGVVATTMFAFTLSFDEFIRTLFVIGNQRTISTIRLPSPPT